MGAPLPPPVLDADRRDDWPRQLRRYRAAESTRLVWRDVLGLDDVREEKHGLVFDLQHSGYSLGAILALGSEKRASIDMLKQCRKLAEDHSADGKKAKAVFVANQQRSSPYPESSKERMALDKAEDDFARQEKICIIPAFLLFEAVNKALKGYKPRRLDLEKLIAETNGILADFG